MADVSIASAGVAQRRVVVFDLDGTLVDSLPDIVASFRRAFVARGLGAPPEDAVRALVGRPLEEMAEAFVDGASEVDAVCDAYREIYPRHFTDATRPFPGVLDVLETLRARGFVTAVATTKRTEMARRLVAAVGLEGSLDHVQGTDGIPHKPAPDVIFAALRAVRAEGTWMVGDTVTDLQAGRAAGLRTYGVTWGTHDRARLEAERPDVVSDDLADLLRLV